MRRSWILAWAALTFSVDIAAGADDRPLVLDVWPGKVPGDHGRIGPERTRTGADAPTPDAIWITDVTRPTISVFRPDAAKDTRVAMVVCPGGGYWNLEWDKEGTEVAERLRSAGITGIVLKYRVPRRPGEPEALPAPGPLLDAQRAMSLVRSRAGEWGIDPGRIGIGGFSAGGHLAIATATSFDRRGYEPIDDVDRASCRPDFAVAAYPGYLLAKRGGDELAPYIRIPKGTCPIFLVHATDDNEPGAQPDHSLVFYRALRRSGVPVELHVYAEGGHGFGVRPTGLPVSRWTDRLLDWLSQRGILRSGTAGTPGDRPEALLEGERGIAARHPGDRGIESDPDVLFRDDFEAGELGASWDMAYHRPNLRITAEPADVRHGARALEITVPRQPGELSNELVKRLGAGHDVVFLRYYAKFDPGFDPVGSSHNGAILSAISPGLPYATPGVRADGRNKFLASLEDWRGEAGTRSPGPLNVYCYHPAQRDVWGDHFFPTGIVLPNTSLPGDFGPSFVARPDVTPQLGRWYCHELMVKANAPGRRDGRIAAWLDGKLIMDFPGLRLRDAGSLKINHATIGLHIKSSPDRANRRWYDDVVIATSYIGPRVEP
ncbi:Acetylxylan esterase precursor [Aquisphaera giovannonii]|uniref:Acetylxylan esterase n=1 Tax=Aquisphaera giovannonii TaxID=406548 RepID=A0A5B9W6G5_9BACT|nr:alpha/beta hydrolase [Aquisphaera giovannonii]QEH35561.1 Acetylxylan esterase precursor [Aquisphaera giovannonii]